jgi:hypothetical protein
MRGGKAQIGDEGEQQNENGQRCPIDFGHGSPPPEISFLVFSLRSLSKSWNLSRVFKRRAEYGD